MSARLSLGGSEQTASRSPRDTLRDPSISFGINAVAGVAIILVLVHLVPLLFASAAMLRVLHSE